MSDDEGTPPPYQWSERTQLLVVIGLSIWLLVAMASGLVFLYCLRTV